MVHPTQIAGSFDNDFAALADFGRRSLERLRGSASTLEQACSYALQTPGKRFRMVLVYAAADLLGISRERVLALSCAVELIHTASLIHDDLPALDNDTLRRGVPTTHVVFGEAVALLAGDAMLALALKAVVESPESDRTKVAVMQLLSSAAVDICEGQVLDLEQERAKGCGREGLECRHRKKTGSLIAAAVSGPALYLEEAEHRARFSELLRKFGYELGLLFQITDDILDSTATTDALGKHAHSDERLGRTTFVTEFGVAGARTLAEQGAQRAGELLQPFGERSHFLRELTRWVLTRQR